MWLREWMIGASTTASTQATRRRTRTGLTHQTRSTPQTLQNITSIQGLPQGQARASRQNLHKNPRAKCSWTSRQKLSCTGRRIAVRSEEHTSELQSQFHLVCRLLLEKKN